MFYSSHPNIFDFTEKLKTIQTNNYLKIRASMNEIPMEKPQKQNIVSMREIQNDFITGGSKIFEQDLFIQFINFRIKHTTCILQR
jgi:hypothetical protein